MSPRPFFWGRRVGIACSMLAAATFGSYLEWYSSVDYGDYGLATIELLIFVAMLVTWAALAPAMATWECLAQRSVRRLSGLTTTLVLAAYVAIPLVVFAAVTHAPVGLVPHAGWFNLSEVPFDQYTMSASNLALLGSIGSMAVTLLGRLAGTTLSIVTSVALFGASAWFGWTVPYSVLPNETPSQWQWVFAAGALVIASTVAFRTGGTTTLARHLDPRSRN